MKQFVLDNGLKVYIDEDHHTSSVFGAVIVKAGGKNDPQDATGLAHYFEHIMFKGTDKIGTTDYASEKILLDQISDKYDQLGKISDDAERLVVLNEINELSVKAADYAIPNEVDKVIKKYGGIGVNAGTSFDQTIYFNSFPSSQIERWLDIYSERFRNPVFRLFQSELETVYEEKNRMSDNPMQSLLFDVFLKNLYKKHPYGQQPLIGTAEHLKSPSISKMQNFFNTYYVANNMSLLLAGDVDADAIMPLIKERFGCLRKGDVPAFNIPEESPLTGEVVDVKATPIPLVLLAYRTVPANHPDELSLEICNRLLSNGATGLLDKIVFDNNLMQAQAFPLTFFDYGANVFMYMPKIVGQKFESADQFVFKAIEDLCSGLFDEDDLQAIKLAKEKELLLNLEDLDKRSQLMMQAIATGTPWEEVLNSIQKVGQLTKADIVTIAKKYFSGNNYFLLHSHKGKLKTEKIKKPDFAPIIPKNTEAQSDYAKYLETIPEGKLKPRFVDFEKDVKISTLKEGVKLYASANPVNTVFTLNLIYRVNIFTHKFSPHVAEYMNLIGTTEKSYTLFKRELQKIGADITFSDTENGFSIKLTGFDAYFEETLSLLNELITQPQPDDTHLKKFVENAKASYKAILEMPDMMAAAMKEYALYGEASKYLDIMPIKAVKKIKSEDLLKGLKELMSYEVDVLYCGTLSDEKIKAALANQNLFTAQLRKATLPYYREVKDYKQSEVWLIHDKKAVQAQINIIAKTVGIDLKTRAVADAFNQYFGIGMSSLVFQEIREFRSLAYGAYARYRLPNNLFADRNTYCEASMQTQNDKTIEALEVLKALFEHMPEKPERLDIIKQSLIQTTLLNVPAFRDIPAIVAIWQRSAYEQDPNKTCLEVYENLQFQDIVDFYLNYVQGKTKIYCIYGDMKAIDEGALMQYGKITTYKSKNIITE